MWEASHEFQAFYAVLQQFNAQTPGDKPHVSAFTHMRRLFQPRSCAIISVMSWGNAATRRTVSLLTGWLNPKTAACRACRSNAPNPARALSGNAPLATLR